MTSQGLGLALIWYTGKAERAVAGVPGSPGPSVVSETQHLQEKRKSGSWERCEMWMGAWGETDELK